MGCSREPGIVTKSQYRIWLVVYVVLLFAALSAGYERTQPPEEIPLVALGDVFAP
jgi:hypothetical protein